MSTEQAIIFHALQIKHTAYVSIEAAVTRIV